MHFKVTISNYLPLDRMFFKVLKFFAYISRLERLQNNTNSLISSTHNKTEIFTMISMWTNPIVRYEGAFLA